LTPAPPQLTVQARQAALQQAKIARQERAQVKRAITLGEISIFDALNDPRESIRRMERRRISPTRRIGGLGQLQLRGLGKELAVTKGEPKRGNLIVISGPGGVGKSTITALLRNDPRFWISVSATTRQPRPGERDGVDYAFFGDQRFQEMIDSGNFLEWAEFAGNRYGTPSAPVSEWRALGKHVILEIEIDGARQVRTREPGATLVFIAPPSWDELVRRLASRGTDSQERRAARLALAEQEMAAAGEFDAILVNDQVEGLIDKLVSLATA